MKSTCIKHVARGMCCAFAVVLFILSATGPARAQGVPSWTSNDAYTVWAAWDGSFSVTSGNERWYSETNDGVTTGCGLWQEANELRILEQAYSYAVNVWHTKRPQMYIDEINAMCSGITNNFEGEWLDCNPGANDDVMWTCAAFVNAYAMTSNSEWLHEAQNNFNTVYNWAQMVPGDVPHYGLGQAQIKYTNNGVVSYYPTNADSPVNFAGIVAANLLVAYCDDNKSQDYHNDAYYLWQFAVDNNNLYKTNGKVWDSVTGVTDYTYNYGNALEAAASMTSINTNFQKSIITNIVAYLEFSFGGGAHPYRGKWTNGTSTYNLFPFYGDPTNGNAKNNAGYNSICFRGLGSVWDYLGSVDKDWVDANVYAPFYHRNRTSNLEWGDFTNNTPDIPLYSWDCCNGVSGILFIPPTN